MDTGTFIKVSARVDDFLRGDDGGGAIIEKLGGVPMMDHISTDLLYAWQ